MQACIFDLDGTLLDSLKVWEQIDTAFLHKRGHTVPPDYGEAVASLGLREAANYTITRFGLTEDADSLIAEWKALASYAYSHTIPLKPYAKEYLCALKACGIKLAVATSLPASLYTPALQRHGLLPLFDALCSVDEVTRSKNHPDIYILAAQRLGIDPQMCEKEDLACIYVFEDIPQALRSAKYLGMTVYGVYDKSSVEPWETIIEIADGVIYDFRNAPHYR
ncbi:MAG: HAD family phosphatase [Peptococcaceae bacterium]|nr:HAD family phosphatase [Peptococcaceae bacterium]